MRLSLRYPKYAACARKGAGGVSVRDPKWGREFPLMTRALNDCSIFRS